ncbi:DUF3613 domain-containing protein [Sinimarinibacterium thermocellulolyticum]|uniref:DUF3613 domain-containing protein n=1 Tax=Sinimarinibacterium thermocellulolyticum TaxID=3170016 RepID=A0ABV2A6E0_9GAMM
MNGRYPVAMALAAGLAMAAASAAEPPRIGDDTRAWLDLQAGGNAATAEKRPMPGEVAEKVYERYLNSFENRIPEEFERESFVSGGGG